MAAPLVKFDPSAETRPSVSYPTSKNLVPNSSLELSNPWTASGDFDINWETNPNAAHGTKALSVTVDYSNVGTNAWLTLPVSVAAGGKKRAAVWVYVAPSSSLIGQVISIGASTTSTPVVGANHTLVSGLQVITRDLSTTAANYIFLGVTVSSTLASGGTFLLDSSAIYATSGGIGVDEWEPANGEPFYMEGMQWLVSGAATFKGLELEPGDTLTSRVPGGGYMTVDQVSWELKKGPPRPTSWTVIVLNPNGDEFVLNPVGDLSITENFDEVTAEFEIPIYASGLPNITDLVSDILFLRGHVLLYRLRVFSSEDVLTREEHLTKISCASYEKILREGRIIYETADMSHADQHVLAWNILQLTQARQTLGITQYPNTPSGVSRSTTIKPGQSVAEAMDGVAAAGDGFDWWIDAGLRYRAQTPRRESLIDDEWTWGAETAEFTRTPITEAFASSVYVTGATGTTTIPGGATYPPPPPVLREVSSKPYGRWEKTFNDSNIVTSASLIKKADWHLGITAKFRPTYSIVLEQGVWSPAVQLGGIVSIRAQADARMSFKVAARIEELTIDVSSDGAETVSVMLRAETDEIDLDDTLPPAVNTSPNTPPAGTVIIGPPAPTGLSTTLQRISPVDNLGHAITRLDERLTQAERSGAGATGAFVKIAGDTMTGPLNGITPTAAAHLTRKDYVDGLSGGRVAKTGDTMSGNLGMGPGAKIDFTDELGMKLDLYGGTYWLGIASGTLQYASGGSHQFYGQVNTDTHFSAAGSVYANSGRVRMGAWQSAPYAAGWGGLIGSRGYILIDYSDGSGGNMHVRGNNNLYIGGASTDDMYFTGTGIRSISNHYFSQGISVEGGASVASSLSAGGNISAAGLTTIGGWSSDGAYCALMGHYGYHLLGKGGADGAVHTRGNNAGWNHYIGAGSYIQLENWTIAALGAGSGGTVVQKGDGVLANAASRRILKEQIEPLPEKVDAGAVIDALEPVTFIWRKRDDAASQFYALQRAHMETPHEGEDTAPEISEEMAAAVPPFDEDAAEAWRKADLRFGLIADDVAVIRPEMANWEWEKDKDGKPTTELIPGSWNEQALITVLVQGMKDLRARVADLEGQVADLITRVA